MAERGVKNLILLSRNAQRSRQTEGGFLRALEALGTNVVIESCDICDLEALTGIVQKITKTLPPIKGVIHSAMILKVPYPPLCSFMSPQLVSRCQR